MQEWNLTAGDPHALTLACDARLEKPDYANDHIWRLRLTGGEPPALSVETTYGLRARLMRLFPRFGESGILHTDPAAFDQPPRLRRFAPNYAAISASPFAQIDVQSEYWVPRSQVLTGKLTVANRSTLTRRIRLELVAQLAPLGDGHGMTPLQMQVTSVLEGQTENLIPVLFLNGGPEPGTGSFPALTMDLELLPGSQRQLTWALAALRDLSQSFELARRTTARRWDAEMTRIQLQDSGSQIEVESGNPDWDAALAFSQKVANSLLMGPEPGLPHPSFVLTRMPDQGYSFKGDGSDYSRLWNGQTALDAYLLSGLILPGGSAWMRGVLLNFLAAQSADGTVDWRPGLAGQRSRRIAQPLLASLAWRLYQHDQDRSFLAQAFPALLRSFQAWFLPEHDRDGDGFPEWDHPFQTGYEDNPAFGAWRTGGQGVAIETFEDPALGAMLARECHSLALIGRQAGQFDALPFLETRLSSLQAAVESCWDQTACTYRYRDRDTHTAQPGKALGEWTEAGVFSQKTAFVAPQRLLFRLTSESDATRKSTIQVFGQTAKGPHMEVITANQIPWSQRQAVVTSQATFQKIDQISIQGINPGDRVALQSVDYAQENCTQLLPLWALIPSHDRARQILDNSLRNSARYASPSGLMTEPGPTAADHWTSGQTVLVPWNTLIAEGLLEYGFRAEAADLVSRMLNGISGTLRREGAFRSVYAANGGKASGDMNHLTGLAPLRLFLETLGVRILSPWKVIVSDFNPFPGPVTVKYRGLIVIRGEEQTRVVFPDGQTTTVTGSDTHIVSMA